MPDSATAQTMWQLTEVPGPGLVLPAARAGARGRKFDFGSGLRNCSLTPTAVSIGSNLTSPFPSQQMELALSNLAPLASLLGCCAPPHRRTPQTRSWLHARLVSARGLLQNRAPGASRKWQTTLTAPVCFSLFYIISSSVSGLVMFGWGFEPLSKPPMTT